MNSTKARLSVECLCAEFLLGAGLQRQFLTKQQEVPDSSLQHLHVSIHAGLNRVAMCTRNAEAEGIAGPSVNVGRAPAQEICQSIQPWVGCLFELQKQKE